MFQARACSIVQASADLMIDAITGQPLSAVSSLAQRFRAVVTGADDAVDELGSLNAFSAVRKLPVRQKCALLPWESLEFMLGGRSS